MTLELLKTFVLMILEKFLYNGSVIFLLSNQKPHNVKLKFFVFAAVLNLFISCKKNDTPNPNPDPQQPVVTAEMIKDSTLIYSRDIYLWYSQIPASFNARSYAGPNEIMTAIRSYSNEPGFSQPVDRWSFAVK